MNERSHRLVVIGWDGADWSSIEPLLQQGRMPHLASLLADSRRSEVEGLVGVGDDAHWATFATGVGPGVHGRFHYVQREPAGIDMLPTPHLVEPFWASVAARGRSVSVLDVPKAPLAEQARVRQVVDWMPHGPSGPDPRCWPDDLLEGDRWQRPAGAFDRCNHYVDDADERAAHHRTVDERRELRTARLLDWLTDDPSELTIAVYAAAHCIGHHHWDTHRALAPDDPLSHQLVELDRDLGKVLDVVGDDCPVVLFSLTGMTSQASADHAVHAAVATLERSWVRRRPAALLRTAGLRLVRRALRRRRPHPAERVFGIVPTRFNNATGIRISVTGRDRLGVVAPARRRALADWIVDELRSMVDEHDRPVLADVIAVEDRYPGPHAHAHVDVIADWAGHPSSRVRGRSFGPIETTPSPPERPGEHRDGGWIVSPHRLVDPGPRLRIDELAGVIGAWLGEVAPSRT